MPKISILMTSYNHERFIRESIEGILAQTYKDFELIIVDDCSQDASFNIIKSFTDSRIIKIRNKKNKGPEHAFEILHTIAKGEYIAIADSDNVWEPKKLQKQLAFLEKNKTYAAVFTLTTTIDETGREYTNKKNDYFAVFNIENRSRYAWLNYFFYRGNCLCHPSVLIRKEAYKECGMIVNGSWQLPDFYKWIKLCLKHEIFILSDKLVKFRVHKNNISGMGNIENILRSHNELYQLYSLFYELKPEELLLVFKDAAKFVVDGQVNVKFVVSKLLLSLDIPAAQAVGLNTLFKMLNSDEDRAQILELYDYDDVAYKLDETIHSPFVLSSAHVEIYRAKLYFDLGDGFNEDDIMENDFITDTNGNFEISFKNIDFLIGGEKVDGLRLDPCSCFSKIKIKNIYLNSQRADYKINKNNYSTGFEYFRKDGYDVFYTNDPSYIIENFDMPLNNMVIIGQIFKISDVELLSAKNSEINKLIRAYNSSLSWKITQPLRAIKHACVRLKNRFKVY